MRSGATIDTGNVIVIVSPSAIFPLAGSITTPPASGVAFDVSSPSYSSSSADRAGVAGRLNARVQATRNKAAAENRLLIRFMALIPESGGDRSRLQLPFRGGVRIARVR